MPMGPIASLLPRAVPAEKTRGGGRFAARAAALDHIPTLERPQPANARATPSPTPTPAPAAHAAHTPQQHACTPDAPTSPLRAFMAVPRTVKTATEKPIRELAQASVKSLQRLLTHCCPPSKLHQDHAIQPRDAAGADERQVPHVPHGDHQVHQHGSDGQDPRGGRALPPFLARALTNLTKQMLLADDVSGDKVAARWRARPTRTRSPTCTTA